jgi:cyclopropane fatty-acyl-phospholipid synthase-like methyltransferase
MKATKKQIAQVTEVAIQMNHNVEQALHTLNNCSKSIFDAIGAVGVVESSIRANSKHFVDTLALAQKANKLDVSIGSLMTNEQRVANWAI